MSDQPDRWIFTADLPPGLSNPGRFTARLLKWLLRVWGVRCVAIQESAEVKRLQRLVQSLADRCARQSELLSRRAERRSDRRFP